MLDSLLAGIVATGNDTALSTSDWNLGNLTDGVTVGTGYSTAENYTSPTLKRPVYLDFALPGPVYADRVVLWPRTDAESMSGGSHAFPQDFTVSVRPEGTSDYVTVAAGQKPAVHRGLCRANRDAHPDHRDQNSRAFDAAGQHLSRSVRGDTGVRHP